ncbi:MAG: hypothetical protein JSS75_02865 [Bacteroidetes bacterium]|nr:hypothetical protein [Bacteroidota bacterium]
MQTSERAFYYWRSVYAPTQYEHNVCDSLHVRTLYVKFFDVDLGQNGRPSPVATLRFASLPDSTTHIIPTIFITQACLNALQGSEADSLAAHISTLTAQMIAFARLRSVPEIQIDCDWTGKNSPVYFQLLRALRSSPLLHGRQLSATIRLYQLKFISKVGVPPVDRGMLMCYNMGDLTDPNAQNSILDVSVLRQYASSMKAYPLALDIALPIFEWNVLLRDGKYKALIRDLPESELARIAAKIAPHQYSPMLDTVIDGYALKGGDIIRHEAVSPDALEESAKLASANLVHTPGRIAFFHLDSTTIASYHVEILDRLYRRLE